MYVCMYVCVNMRDFLLHRIEVAIAEKFLRRNGFIVASDYDVCSSDNNSSGSGSRPRRGALHYACVWGIRINTFETRNIL
jgi:hypothetical protein